MSQAAEGEPVMEPGRGWVPRFSFALDWESSPPRILVSREGFEPST